MPVVQWSLTAECNYVNIPFLLTETAMPPWVDSNEEETIQQQILALSAVCGRFFAFYLLSQEWGEISNQKLLIPSIRKCLENVHVCYLR